MKLFLIFMIASAVIDASFRLYALAKADYPRPIQIARNYDVLLVVTKQIVIFWAFHLITALPAHLKKGDLVDCERALPLQSSTPAGQ